MTAVRSADEMTVTSKPGPAPRKLRATFRRKQTVARWVVVVLVGAFFATPLIALVDTSTRTLGSTRTGRAWDSLLHLGDDGSIYAPLWTGLKASLVLMVLTVVLMLVLMVPTMTWVRLRLPWVRRPMEFICLLPLTIPAIVLVVGLAPIYRQVSGILSTDAIWLCFAYVVLVLPYSYRSLDAGLEAIDVKTLSEAARSLGSSWGGLLWRIVLPNIRSAVISASFITVALVLGEYTVSSLLSRNTLQTAMVLVGAQDPRVAMALSVIALVLVFLLLVVLSFFGDARKGNRRPKGRKAVQ